ncbi:MAG TPA: tRNA (adenosine(37)-N6)-dimethylallyltransferase MiaA [Anaerolineales bacterium]|nr:tRNA (adenosine(37)-N6)-dimethylallyltransferase MiaA [Anaerolineales bacterium]
MQSPDQEQNPTDPSRPAGSKPFLILIVGPTVVGKTEVAIQLAERLNGEVVSADSRLFYRGMDIGTAKPTHEEQRRVPHHLIDIANPDETLSLAVFQQKAREVIVDIHTRNKLPFLVGGTGQYIRAVTQGWTPPEVKPNEQLRKELERQKEENGIHWLYENLRELDPEAAKNIDPRNFRRTIRALEVIMTTGKKFSEQRSQTDSPYRLITFGLSRPRTELYERVDARIESMFANGFLDEVQGLLAKGYSPALPTMSAIGYRECVQVIEGRITIAEAKQFIRRATRVFVRRQANWFKESDPEILWFRVDEGIVERIAEQIRRRLLRRDEQEPSSQPPEEG